jgi:hypothetical protein
MKTYSITRDLLNFDIFVSLKAAYYIWDDSKRVLGRLITLF